LIREIFNNAPFDATISVVSLWLKNLTDDKNTLGLLDKKDILYKLIDKNYINPNKAFPNWIKGLLEEQNALTVENFRKNRLEYLKKFDFQENKIDFNNDWFLEHFKIVATDLTTSSKVAFPKMARLYCKNWENSTDFSVGDYVAASMSVPFFFKHFEISDLPPDTKEDWENLTGYTGEIPSKAVFTDGGIASNFPIDSFHTKTGNPKCPTLGVKLGDDRSASFHFRQAWIKDAKDYKPHGINDTGNIAEFTSSILNTARQMGDFEFIHKNPDYKQLVSWIKVDENQAFNFAMSNDELIDLFLEGVKAARIFLSEKRDSTEYFFDWEQYKQFRKAI
jgi:NTE family protein